MSILKSIGAVVAGMAFVIVASTGTDFALQHSVLPAMNTPAVTAPLLALALAYRTVYGVVGGWITAKLAPRRPVKHAVILGSVGTVAAVAGVIANWNLGQQWYAIALAVLSLPQTWLGGKLASRR